MKIIEYFNSDRQVHWLSQIKKSDWGAGQYLYQLLDEGKLQDAVGENVKVLLLTEGGRTYFVLYLRRKRRYTADRPDPVDWICVYFSQIQGTPPYRKIVLGNRGHCQIRECA